MVVLTYLGSKWPYAFDIFQLWEVYFNSDVLLEMVVLFHIDDCQISKPKDAVIDIFLAFLYS